MEEDRSIEEGKPLAWLSYLGLLFLIPLLVLKENKFAQFHAKQGVAFFIGWVIGFIALLIITFILGFIPIIGLILNTLLWILFWIFFVIMAILGIVNSLQGKYWRMPIFANFTQKLFPSNV